MYQYTINELKIQDAFYWKQAVCKYFTQREKRRKYPPLFSLGFLFLLFIHKCANLIDNIRYGIDNVVHGGIGRLHLQQLHLVAADHQKTDGVQGNTRAGAPPPKFVLSTFLDWKSLPPEAKPKDTLLTG